MRRQLLVPFKSLGGGQPWLKHSPLCAAVGLTVFALGGCMKLSGSQAGRSDSEATKPSNSTGQSVDLLLMAAEPTKVDLLFVVDNSKSMAVKQKLFSQAVPRILGRLAKPDCVRRDEQNRIVERVAQHAGCADGFAPESRPISDFHVAVISSSLGSTAEPGGCSDPAYPEKNDRARPMPLVRPNAGLGSAPFLSWTGSSDLGDFAAAVGEQIVAAGENGCGYEATMESWYRFLVDPNPPSNIVQDERGYFMPEGRDEELLQIRREFLRTDSVVGIVVLSDENDCSIMNGGSYYPGAAGGGIAARSASGQFTAATPTCEANANDVCCLSCLQAPTSIPDECQAEFTAACAEVPQLPPSEDRVNMRCFDQKRRFGIDLLYPIERYVSALTLGLIADSRQLADAALVPNPLLMGPDGDAKRPPGRVFFSAVVGVPWQDLATPDTVEDAGSLKLLRGAELHDIVPGTDLSRWNLMLGDAGHAASSLHCKQYPDDSSCGAPPTEPADPFMIESIEPRSLGRTHPITGDAISPPGVWNAINGHEYDNEVPAADGRPAQDDLQYACTFPLWPYEAEVSEADCGPTSGSCDCADEPSKNRPLCEGHDGTEAATNHQSYARAYPSTRILEVARAVSTSTNVAVASVCPKVHDSGSSSYGYAPAAGAVSEVLAGGLAGLCISQLTYDEEAHRLPCRVVEVHAEGAADGACERPGRLTLSAHTREKVLEFMEESALCGDESPCSEVEACEIQQLVAGDEMGGDECLNSIVYPDGLASGFCYVDESQGSGSGVLVASCPAGQKQRLRYVGAEPRHGQALLVCEDGVILP